jgi:hypothetical protein
MDKQRRVQPSALHPSPGFLRRDLPPVQIVDVSGLPEGGRTTSGYAEFKISTPEARCRIKGVVRWVPAADNSRTRPEDYWFLAGVPPAPYTLFGATGLWLAKRDDVDLGGRGLAPVENLMGDLFAPARIQRGCLGFFFEVETAAHELWGRLEADCGNFPGDGRWVVKAAADAVEEMAREEWDRLTCRFYLSCITGLQLANPQF